MTGNFLAFIFLTLTMGTMAAGWLSARWQRRQALILLISGVAAVATWLMGQATTLWQLTLLTALVWAAGGALLTLLNIVIGLHAARHERGKLFGIFGLTNALAGILGGVVAGPVAEHWGYAALFKLMALTWLLQMGMAFFLAEPQSTKPLTKAAVKPTQATTDALPKWVSLSSYALLLIATSLLYNIGAFVASFGRSLAMDQQGFTVTTLSLMAALGSAVSLLIIPWLGWLSDRVNRSWLLLLLYLCSGLSLVGLVNATTGTMFLTVTVLMAITNAERAISSALFADHLSPQAFDRGMALIEATRWLGAVIGFSATGYAVGWLGLPAALLSSTLFPLLAMGLLVINRLRWLTQAGRWQLGDDWRIVRWFILISICMVAVFFFGTTTTHAQGSRTCRDEGNLTICGDQLESFQDLGIDGYRLSGNVTIATRGGAPVLRVVNGAADALAGDPKLAQARFEHVAEDRLSPFGKKDVIFGDISFINDPRQRSPLAMDGAFIPTPDGTNGNLFPGVFWVDTQGQSIFTPPPGVVPAYPAELATEMISLYEPRFLDHLGLRAMYPDDATLEDRSLFAGEYNVKDRDFFAQITIPKLRLFENAENKELPITLRITMDEKGNYTGSADGFKLRMAGMTGEAKGIVVKPGEFEAATFEFSKADNPSLPNLDPTNPNLVFRLEGLQYKDGHFPDRWRDD